MAAFENETTTSPYVAPRSWVTVYNETTKPIPPYGAVEIFGYLPDGAARVRRVQGISVSNIIINGPTLIPIEAYGQCQVGWPAVVGWNGTEESGSTPKIGQTWGFERDNFFLTRNRTGFVCLTDAQDQVVNVTPEPGSQVDMVYVSGGMNEDGLYPATAYKFNAVTRSYEAIGECWVKDTSP